MVRRGSIKSVTLFEGTCVESSKRCTFHGASRNNPGNRLHAEWTVHRCIAAHVSIYGNALRLLCSGVLRIDTATDVDPPQLWRSSLPWGLLRKRDEITPSTCRDGDRADINLSNFNIECPMYTVLPYFRGYNNCVLADARPSADVYGSVTP